MKCKFLTYTLMSYVFMLLCPVPLGVCTCLCPIGYAFADDSIAIIEIYNQENKVIGKEAGVFTSEDEVLTHSYVFSAVDKAVLKVKDKNYTIKGICGRDTKKELLKIKIDVKGFKPAIFGREIKEKQTVFISLPEGKAIEGRVVSVGERIKIEVFSPVPKIRGLPVFNKDEEVIGIIEFYIKDKSYVYAIPVLLEEISFEKLPLLSISAWKEKRTKEWMESDIGKRQTIVYLMGMGKYEETIARLKELIKKHPDDKEAYFKLGVCLGKLGRYEEACDTFKKFVELSPDDLKARYNLGTLYTKMGNKEAAQKEYEFLKKLNTKEAKGLSVRLLNYIEKGEVL